MRKGWRVHCGDSDGQVTYSPRPTPDIVGGYAKRTSVPYNFEVDMDCRACLWKMSCGSSKDIGEPRLWQDTSVDIQHFNGMSQVVVRKDYCCNGANCTGATSWDSGLCWRENWSLWRRKLSYGRLFWVVGASSQTKEQQQQFYWRMLTSLLNNPGNLGWTSKIKHNINKGDAPPICQSVCEIPLFRQDQGLARKLFKKMLEKDVIQHCSSPIALVGKKDGWRSSILHGLLEGRCCDKWCCSGSAMCLPPSIGWWTWHGSGWICSAWWTSCLVHVLWRCHHYWEDIPSTSPEPDPCVSKAMWSRSQANQRNVFCSLNKWSFSDT